MSMVPKDNKHLQVYAGLAARIGLLSEQYEIISDCLLDNEQYDVTLHLCLLQTLLTSVVEQLENNFGLGEWDNNYLNKPLRDKATASVLGLTSDMIKSEWDKGTTILNILQYIRNSLSHPSKTLPGVKTYPATGFTLHEDDKGKIESIEFVVGRHNTDNEFRRFEAEETANRFIRDNRLHSKGVSIARSDVPPCYYLVKNGKVYAPTFRIVMDVNSIKKLVRELSLLLAQPLREDWPGGEFSSDLTTPKLAAQNL